MMFSTTCYIIIIESLLGALWQNKMESVKYTIKLSDLYVSWEMLLILLSKNCRPLF